MSQITREERLHQVYGAKNREELRRRYDEWAEDYDADVQAFGKINVAIAAGLVGRYVAPHHGTILDAAAGTGLLGEVLYPIGYTDLVALDLSEGMLAMARSKGVYRGLHRAVLGGPLDLADGSFAAVLALGVFTDGHAGPESLDELIRVTRPGGVLIFTVSENVYHAGFRQAMAAHERAGRWRLEETSAPFSPLSGEVDAPASQVFVYRKH